MKTPVNWKDIEDVAEVLIESVEAAADFVAPEFDVEYDPQTNDYGEKGTFRVCMADGRVFELSAYEVQ